MDASISKVRVGTPKSPSDVVEVVEDFPESHGSDENGGFLIHNPGCSIRRWPAFSRKVLPYLQTGKPTVDCIKGDKGTGPDLPGPPIESNATHVFVAPTFKEESCCYRTIKRSLGSTPKWVDNIYSTDRDCKFFSGEEGMKVDAENREFLRVTCRVSHEGKHLSFTDFHAFPVKKIKVEERCEAKSSKMNSEEKKERLNLIIIGLDATSRLNLHRQMPQTRQFLMEMGAVELVGYNKVADNTFPNVVPLMTGHSESELKKLCWKRAYEPLDNCPWLWHRFEDRGYRTMLVEDAPNIGIFNFERLGFKEQPSDYYLRPFILASERENGHFNYPTVLLCLGPRLATEVVLNYTSKYTDSFFPSDHPVFAFAWSTTMTHDGLALAREADPVVVRHLRHILRPRFRENTALLFISDHGVRAGEFRQTPQGSQEERLPYAFLVLPPSFQQKYPEAMRNLVLNGGHRLTSPFDLHFTLADLLSPLETLTSSSIAKRTKELETSDELPRGISLFLPVPSSRKCSDAGITPHWCTCVNGSAKAEGALSPEESRKAGKALVKSINSLLQESEEGSRKCAILRLAEVREARAVGEEAVLVTVKTNPGGALFEGTVGSRPEEGKGEIYSANFGVSRLNRYGNQSACIGDYHLKLYCYCVDQINTSTLKES
ncbi:hypothetical protein J437_LFUL007622 [Ladona fulva]|uniref:Uncharacterized protein n=1 Tax=Ladona fulva TaxID=123851 RepID=A0A8K0K7Y4_LADFU|nr:hypothetical protein J437_LFUL007622 [Ladona fulva]